MRSFRWKYLLGAAAFAVAFGALPVSAQVPKDLLELDGNLVDDPAAGFDWNNAAGQAVVGEFFDIPDPIGGLQMTQGTKDIHDISQWVFKTVANTTPKDDLRRALAAQVTDPDTGDFILYLGARRQEASGTTTFGFWLLQGDVEIDVNNGNSFSDDEHKEGDVLVVVDVQGNKIVGVRIFEWQGGDGTSGSLTETVTVGQANCNAVMMTATDYLVDICGAVSVDGLFLEVGINFTNLFPDVCIADIMTTTRTSNQPNASVKNFTFRDFETCGLSVTKACTVSDDGFNADFTAFEYSIDGTVATTIGTLFDVDVFEDLTFDGPSGDDVLLASFASVDTTPVNWGPIIIESPTSAPTDKVYAIAATSPGGSQTVVSDLATATCPPVSASPSLTVDKVCRTCLTVEDSMVKVTVLSAGQVCNTGDVPLINVSVTDDHGTVATGDDETVFIGNLAIGQCKPYETGPFQPATVNSANPSSAVFTDAVEAVGQTSLGFVVPSTGPQSAMCELCPSGGDSSGISCPALP